MKTYLLFFIGVLFLMSCEDDTIQETVVDGQMVFTVDGREYVSIVSGSYILVDSLGYYDFSMIAGADFNPLIYPVNAVFFHVNRGFTLTPQTYKIPNVHSSRGIIMECTLNRTSRFTNDCGMSFQEGELVITKIDIENEKISGHFTMPSLCGSGTIAVHGRFDNVEVILVE